MYTVLYNAIYPKCCRDHSGYSTGSANERWHYIVTSSLIGWAHTQNDRMQPGAKLQVAKCWRMIHNVSSYPLCINNLQGCFTGIGAILWLPQCHWSNPEDDYMCDLEHFKPTAKVCKLQQSHDIRYTGMNHSWYGLSYWERTLLCNTFFYWSSPYPEWSLIWMKFASNQQVPKRHQGISLQQHLQQMNWIAEIDVSQGANTEDSALVRQTADWRGWQPKWFIWHNGKQYHIDCT